MHQNRYWSRPISGRADTNAALRQIKDKAVALLVDNEAGGIVAAVQTRQAAAIARRLNAHDSLVRMVKELRDAAVNTPVLDGSEDWTALIANADGLLATQDTRIEEVAS